MLLSFRNFNILFKFYLQSFNVNQLNYDFKICYKYIKLYFYNNCIFKFYTVPNQIKKFTVLKSPFVFKKSKEQFEVKTFKKYLSCRFDAYVKLLTLFLLIKTCIKNIFSLFKISINQFLNFN